jgi:hypothetical protein
MTSRLDPLGFFVAAFLAGALIVSAISLIVWSMSVTNDRAAYEKCVAAIPNYLDAQEILYQEQECHHG